MRPEDIEITEKLKALNIIPHIPGDILYKYASIEDAIKILTGGTLLYQTPNNFNDPFDMHIGLLDFRQASIDFTLNRFRETHSPADFKILEQKISYDTMESIAKDHLLGWRNDTGILCLSKNRLSTLMWSHYSKKHTGVCLGFTLNQGILGMTPAAFEINYASEVIPRIYNISNNLEDLISFTYWVCTKADVWEYEDEVRVISMNRYGLIPFDKSQLCEIYFGVSTPQTDIDIINEIVRCKGYELTKVGKMKINKQHFNLETTYLSTVPCG